MSTAHTVQTTVSSGSGPSRIVARLIEDDGDVDGITRPQVDQDPTSGISEADHRLRRTAKRRSRAGCLTCRRRRVKCDETRPACTGCLDREHICEWPPSEKTSNRHKFPRAIRSCDECRARKTKCDIINESTRACTSCLDHGFSCSWTESAGSFGLHINPANRTQPSYAAPLDPQSPSYPSLDAPIPFRPLPPIHPELRIRPDEETLIGDLVRLYFTTVHYFGFLTFLHEADYWDRYERGDLPVGLTLLMAANALRFGGRSDTQSRLHLADRWASEAGERLIGQAMMEFGAVELMQIVLSHHYEFQCGRYSRGWILAGIAVRMMTFLRLHMFDESPHPIMKPLLGAESLRRLAWSVYYLDATIDGGNYGFTAIPDGAFTIPLPCDEKPFLQHAPTIKEYMLPSIPPPIKSDLGLAGYLLRAMYARQILAGLHSRIQRRLVPVASVVEFVKQAEIEARQLLGTLPPDIEYTRTNFHILKTQQALFVHLHVMRINCSRHIALLKMLSASYTMPMPDLFDVPACRSQLIQDATTLSGLFHQALEHGTPLDPQLACHAFGGIELLLYQPIRLSNDPVTFAYSKEEVARLLIPLLRVIRESARVSELVALLYPEAVNRMVRLGYSKDLLDEDMLAVLQKVHSLANPDTEFDFHDSFWRYEVAVARNRDGLPVSPNDVLLEVQAPTSTGDLASPLARFQAMLDHGSEGAQYTTGPSNDGLPVEDLQTLMGGAQLPNPMSLSFDWSANL